MAVFDPLGGHTVTVGNSSSLIGWVVMVVDPGDSCHSLYELVIMWIAMAKQATTIVNQRALAARDLAVEMCTRPCIVELSRNLRKVAVAICWTRPFYPPFPYRGLGQTVDFQPQVGGGLAKHLECQSTE